METIRKFKGQLIAIGVFYLILCIEIVGAFCVSNKITGASETGLINNFSELTTTMGDYMKNPFKIIVGIFKEGVFGSFIHGCFWLLVIFIGMTIWFLIKNKSKSEYDGIESGSSDWSKNGEEYRKLPDGSEILNKKEGFILSRNHYLGTDLKKVKINKNILVIGRIWYW